MEKKKNGGIAGIIALVVVVVLLIGAVGFVFRFTNGFNEDFKKFYLVYNGEEIVAKKKTLEFRTNSTSKIDVKYTFDYFNDVPRDYNVEIIPNSDSNFEFTVDGKNMLWSDVDTLAEFFHFNKEASSFSLKMPSERSMQNILSAMYAGQTVEIPDDKDLDSGYPYTLNVSSYNQSVKYRIDFRIFVSVEEIELEEGNLYV